MATANDILLLFLDVTLSVLAGAKDIPLDDVLYTLFGYQETFHDQLIRDMYLSCALSALLMGGLFAASGVTMRGTLRNPIAEPSILGIAQGSIMFAVTVPMLPLLITASGFWTAFTGVGFSGLLVFLFAAKYTGYPDVLCIFLAGSALSIFFLSVASLSALIQNRLQELAFWIAGGSRQADWGVITSSGIVTLVYMGSFLLLSGRVNLLSLGDEVTTPLGIDATGLEEKVILVMIPFYVMCVAVADNIGFVGPFVPYILYSMPPQDARHTLSLSFLPGGTPIVSSDIATRILSVSYELLVGLLTTPLGIPAFLLLMRKECG